MPATPVAPPENLSQRLSEFARAYDLPPESLALAALAIVVVDELKSPFLRLLKRDREIELQPATADNCPELLAVKGATTPLQLAKDFAKRLASPDTAWLGAVAPRGPKRLRTYIGLSQLDIQDDANSGDTEFDKWVSGYLRVLHSCIVEPNIPLEDQIHALDNNWYAEVIRWNDTTVSFMNGSVVSLINAVFVARPKHPAIIATDGAVFNYDELNLTASRVANLLRYEGVVAGDAVAVAIDRSPLLIAALLACFKLGAIYVPVDRRDPIARIELGLEAINARFILENGKNTLKSTLHNIDISREILFSSDDLSISIKPDMAAYAIFTSGTTGNPKLVIVEHGALYNQLCWMINTIPLELHDRTAFKYAINFDASIGEILSTLTQGATLVTAGPETDHRTDRLLETMISGGVTVLDIVPSHLDALLRHDRFGELSALRLVIVGGESIHRPTARKFVEASKAEFWNLYGPTEATITAIASRIDLEEDGAIAIGKPIANVRAYLLNESLQPSKLGDVGEICLSGVQLARGYAGRVTDAQPGFVDNPFLKGTRLYRTGDLGRRMPNGSIKIEGRSDSQQSLRGHRLEPGEVEAALLAHPDVLACAVAVTEVGERPRLAAWIMPNTNVDISTVNLREHMSKHLPQNMIPTAFYKVATLPRTAAGKLDRKALLSSHGELLYAALGSAPTSNIEHLIAEAFAELLGFKPADINTSFFELGGDSLAAILLIERLTSVLGVMLEVNDVFEAPTVSGLAARAQRRSAIPLKRAWRIVLDDGLSEVNAAQWKILDFEMRGVGIAPTCLAVRWTGPLDRISFNEAFVRTIIRHPLLHSNFVKAGRGWRVQPLEELTVSVDYRHSSKKNITDLQLAAQMPAAWLIPFKAGCAPLIRMGAIHISKSEAILLLAAHPAACDRASIELALRDLSRFYFHLTIGCAAPRPLLVTADDHRRWVGEMHTEGTRANISNRTRHLVHLLESVDYADSDVLVNAATNTINGQVTRTVGGSMPNILDQVAHRRGAEMEALLAAALLKASETQGWRWRVLGLPISGRRGLAAIEGVVGCFADTQLLFAPPPGLKIEQMLQFVQHDLASAHAEYLLPLADELSLICSRINFYNMPIVKFRYQRILPMESGTTALKMIPVVPSGYHSHLFFEITHHNDNVIINATYQTCHYNKNDIDEFIDNFISIIKSVIR